MSKETRAKLAPWTVSADTARTNRTSAADTADGHISVQRLRPSSPLVHPVDVMSPDTPCPDIDAVLLRRLRRGDMKAFETVYRMFERRVYTLALRLTGRPDSADEVLQDAMLRMFDRVRQYRGDAPFWGWLKRLVVNECLMRLRSERRRPSESYEDTIADDHGVDPWQGGDSIALEKALMALPDDTRAVLWLFHVEGYTHVEIATLFGRSASFSKSQLARGTRRLRALIETPMEV